MLISTITHIYIYVKGGKIMDDVWVMCNDCRLPVRDSAQVDGRGIMRCGPCHRISRLEEVVKVLAREVSRTSFANLDMESANTLIDFGHGRG